jgi:hypothetical protein
MDIRNTAQSGPVSGMILGQQTNEAWQLTWKAVGRRPMIADRIFETYAHAQSYVDDMHASASAVPGLVISVINDPNEELNGIYYIKSIATGPANPGVLEKSSSSINSITEDEIYNLLGVEKP